METDPDRNPGYSARGRRQGQRRLQEQGQRQSPAPADSGRTGYGVVIIQVFRFISRQVVARSRTPNPVAVTERCSRR